MNYAILGGSILSCRLAELLNSENEVYLIDSRMELGMPTTDIGLLEDRKILSHFMDEPKLNYANQYNNGIRSEWVAKFYAHYLTSIGVNIFTRSKVQKSNDGIEVISTGNMEKIVLEKCKIIDLRQISGDIRMGESQESASLEIHPPIDYSNYIERQGAIISSTEEFENLDIDITRSDGTREIWWKSPVKIQPENGFLERMTNFGPRGVENNSIDNLFKIAEQIFEEFSN